MINLPVDASPSPSMKRPNQGRLIAGASITALAIVVCVIGLGIIGIRLIQQAQREADAIVQVVQQFIEAGRRNDPATGIMLFTTDNSGNKVSEADIKQLFVQRSEVFTNVVDVRREGFHIYQGTHGISATLKGTITYRDQPVRHYTAQLRQIDGVWRLTRLDLADRIGT